MLNSICQLAREAGNTIIQFYNNNKLVSINHKLDNSPVTSADIAAHKIIIQGLKKLSPEVPILSEENPPDWKKRRYWGKYWLVDPLDGTKEFIKHNGEFTVNIALIEQGEPTLGVVYAPALNVMYFSSKGKAWKEENGHRTQIHVREAYPPLVVVSRSHKDQKDKQLREYLYQLGEYKTAEIGSSLKFCLVAEGIAQIYPRFSPTNIWDIGAGHAVAVAAGAYIYDWQGKTLDYFPRQSFLNFGFRVSVF